MNIIPDKFDWDKWHKQALEDSKMEGQIFRLIPVLSFEQVQSYIAELEAENDQLTARWRQERQDDKSPNDTQTQTIVYGSELPEVK